MPKIELNNRLSPCSYDIYILGYGGKEGGKVSNIQKKIFLDFEKCCEETKFGQRKTVFEKATLVMVINQVDVNDKKDERKVLREKYFRQRKEQM